MENKTLNARICQERILATLYSCVYEPAVSVLLCDPYADLSLARQTLINTTHITRQEEVESTFSTHIIMPFFSKSDSTKPLPSTPEAEEPKRPGTSGTEMLLTTKRRTAKDQFNATVRAENAYKAKKRSAGARQHRVDASTHFKESFSHFGKGVKSCCNMVVAIPWMFRGWKEQRQERNEAKSVERYEKQKQKLEAKMAKREGIKEKAKDDESEAEAS